MRCATRRAWNRLWVAQITVMPSAACAFGNDLLDQSHARGIKVGRRLIQNQHVGVSHQRPGQRHELHLAAGQRPDGLRGERLESQASPQRGQRTCCP